MFLHEISKKERKPRRILTTELVNEILAMTQTEKYCIKEIAKHLQVSRQTVWKIQKSARRGERFIEASEKRKLTCLARNAQVNEIDKIIFNTALKYNSLSQLEMRELIREQSGLMISTATISRKLRKMNINTKNRMIMNKSMERSSNEVVNNKSKLRRICKQDEEQYSTPQKDLPNPAELLMPSSMEKMMTNRQTTHIERVEEDIDGFPNAQSVSVSDSEHINNEEYADIENGMDVIQDLMPRSKEMLKLQQELAEVEMKYYRNKTLHLSKMNENSKCKQTLMLLQSRKLQLEIEKMQTN